MRVIGESYRLETASKGGLSLVSIHGLWMKSVATVTNLGGELSVGVHDSLLSKTWRVDNYSIVFLFLLLLEDTDEESNRTCMRLVWVRSSHKRQKSWGRSNRSGKNGYAARHRPGWRHHEKQWETYSHRRNDCHGRRRPFRNLR